MNKHRIIFIIVALALIIGSLAGCAEEPPTIENTSIEFTGLHYVEDLSYVESSIWEEWPFSSGIHLEYGSHVFFENGASVGCLYINTQTDTALPCIVEIYRNDTGECIYSTNGKRVPFLIKYDKLDVELPAGTYDCTVMWHLLARDRDVVIHKVGAEITIQVGE